MGYLISGFQVEHEPEPGFWGVGGDVGRKLVLMCTEVGEPVQWDERQGRTILTD